MLKNNKVKKSTLSSTTSSTKSPKSKLSKSKSSSSKSKSTTPLKTTKRNITLTRVKRSGEEIKHNVPQGILNSTKQGPLGQRLELLQQLSQSIIDGKDIELPLDVQQHIAKSKEKCIDEQQLINELTQLQLLPKDFVGVDINNIDSVNNFLQLAQKVNQSSPQQLKKGYQSNIQHSDSEHDDDHDHGHGHHHHEPGTHSNIFGKDYWYNPDEDSDFEPHYDAPPSGVHAFPHATTKYTFKIRFQHQQNQDDYKNNVHILDIYEGETYFDAVHRHGLEFPDVKCLPDSTHIQESQFFEGPSGCGGCIGYFPIGYRQLLPPLTDNEIIRVRAFWDFRIHQPKTQRDGGKVDAIRFLCSTNFTPEFDGVEIYAPGTEYPFIDDIDHIKQGHSAMV